MAGAHLVGLVGVGGTRYRAHVRVLVTLTLVLFVLLPLFLIGGALTLTGFLGLTLASTESGAVGWIITAIGLVMLALGAGVIALMIRARRSVPRWQQAMGAPVLSWQAAEQMAANHMRAYGFSDARTTRRGADGGLDVVSRWGVAQVKYYANPVGRPDVQKLRGAAHGQQRALFYAMSGFTRGAHEFADQAGVALFQFNQAGMVWPVNARARAYRKPEQAPT